MRCIHFGDVHFDAANADRALASLAVVEETGRREAVDAFALAGDLFNRGIQNSAAGRLPDLLAAIGRLLDIAPVIAVSGTPTHDVAGCYAPMQALSYNFHLLGPGEAKVFSDAIFLGLPEPSKTWLLAGTNGLSAAEADERVKAELRKILLGMGAARAEHPEIPAVLVYHGAVEGATLANGQLLEGGIALGSEDLALVGADYYALGHVHLAQEIRGLPAYYAGSAFPVDWGELDQKGCNLVEFMETAAVMEDDRTAVAFDPIVTRIDFPHPPRRKVIVEMSGSFGGQLSIPGQIGDVLGYQVWVVVKAPKDSDMITAGILTGMLDAGAVEGSRVTLEAIPTETVRAAEITEQKHLRDKVRVYAEASDEATPTESVLAKADALELEVVAGMADAGERWRIRKLRLRGATGIWKGLGLDEVTLDLDRYDAGLIALVGPNGSGKTTLFENMHPWPCLLTREGKLQDHFRLRDSARELWLVGERTGVEYRSLMLIDGVNATGKAEYYLFHHPYNSAESPLTNGRKEDYEAAIERLFGSLALFLRSAFVSQRATKNNPDLAEATKGEKKAIFRELAGLDYLQAAAESAKGKGAEIEAEVSRAEAVIAGQQQALEALPELRTKVERTTAELEKQETELFALEIEGKKRAEEAKDLADALEKQRAAERQIAEALETFKAAGTDAAKAKTEISSLATALAGKDAAEAELAVFEQLREEERQESERAKQHAELIARTQSEYANALSTHRDHEAEVQRKHSETQKEMVTLEGDRRVVLTQIERLIADIAIPEKACPQCGYIDPERLKRRETWQDDLGKAQERAHGLAQDIEEKRRELVAIDAEKVEPPDAPNLPTFDDTSLREIRGKLAKLNPSALKAIIEKARDASTRIEELSMVAADHEAAAVAAMDRADELRGNLDGTLEGRAEQAKAVLEDARKAYIDANGIRASLRSQLELHQQRIAELEQQQAEIEEKQKAIAIEKAEAAEWRYLERACGPDGIQALELDALGPGIAEIANRLLSAAYGTRFAVSFRTTRIAGRGSKVKQVEDFAVFIHDSERESEQDLSTLSGGESVWIKRALCDSFAIIRDRNTGLRFLTAFQDEADGALDPEARQAYFAMLRAAHAESGRRHTIVITHSESAQEAIGQRIVMSELAKEAVT
jgi:exonuclease SbcC